MIYRCFSEDQKSYSSKIITQYFTSPIFGAQHWTPAVELLPFLKKCFTLAQEDTNPSVFPSFSARCPHLPLPKNKKGPFSQPVNPGRRRKPAAAFLSPTRDTKGVLCCSCESSLTMTLPSLPPSSPFPHRPRDPWGEREEGELTWMDHRSVGRFEGEPRKVYFGALRNTFRLVVTLFSQLFCILHSIWKLRFEFVISSTVDQRVS